jgi:hypothetical protein
MDHAVCTKSTTPTLDGNTSCGVNHTAGGDPIAELLLLLLLLLVLVLVLLAVDDADACDLPMDDTDSRDTAIVMPSLAMLIDGDDTVMDDASDRPTRSTACSAHVESLLLLDVCV